MSASFFPLTSHPIFLLHPFLSSLGGGERIIITITTCVMTGIQLWMAAWISTPHLICYCNLWEYSLLLEAVTEELQGTPNLLWFKFHINRTDRMFIVPVLNHLYGVWMSLHNVWSYCIASELWIYVRPHTTKKKPLLPESRIWDQAVWLSFSDQPVWQHWKQAAYRYGTHKADTTKLSLSPQSGYTHAHPQYTTRREPLNFIITVRHCFQLPTWNQKIFSQGESEECTSKWYP